MKINKLTNANIYLNGGSLAGTVEEFDMPDVTTIQAEHKALGNLGTLNYAAGFEAMEARLKWTCFDAVESSKLMDPFTTSNIQLRANLETHGPQGRANQVPYTVLVVARPKNVPTGMFKAKENAEFETTLSVDSVLVEADGEEIFFFSALTNEYRVNNNDRAATYRASLGL